MCEAVKKELKPIHVDWTAEVSLWRLICRESADENAVRDDRLAHITHPLDPAAVDERAQVLRALSPEAHGLGLDLEGSRLLPALEHGLRLSALGSRCRICVEGKAGVVDGRRCVDHLVRPARAANACQDGAVGQLVAWH
eukprot:CAMPEP_0171089122 /NCGR_PEP_ID=MMETSP0766_2-20121228/21189_1 /TAXON_ID=439317 /ORGANISM="Gambierdiscus australes, Strain CAWD 149" /LENGTH=138 /DNA_ID=CAMNT_0011546961 /DNA_START=65 /DNA_END=481 /DNA_ORIENTATION=-